MTAARLLLAASVALAAPAADLKPMDQAGYQSLIQAHRGQVLVVNFWATWCAPCREEMPALAALEKKLRGKGLVLVTISADEPEQRKAARDFLARAKFRGPAYLRQTADDQAFIHAVSEQWSGALPATFLYDQRGRLAWSFIGETKIGTVESEVWKLLNR